MSITRPFCSALIAAALSVTAPALAQDEQTDAETAVEYSSETILARIGDVEITLGHVAAMVAQLPDQYRQLPDETLYNGIVEQLVDQQLLAMALDADSLPERVALMLENETRAILARETIQRSMAEDVEEAAVQAAYDEAIGNIPAETEYNASHILVETEEAAQSVIETLNGGGDFAETAKAESTGPSGPNGGQLGWFGAGAMVGPFDAAVQAMEVGTISEEPVQTQFGWHVIRLNETREKPKPTLEETRAQFEDQIRQERLESYIADLRATSDVELFGEGVPPEAIRDTTILPD